MILSPQKYHLHTFVGNLKKINRSSADNNDINNIENKIQIHVITVHTKFRVFPYIILNTLSEISP